MSWTRVVGSIVVLMLIASCTLSAEYVVELTDETFRSVVSKQDVVLVVFGIEDCGLCKKLKFGMEWAAKSMAGTNQTVRFCSVDCVHRGKTTCQRYSVTGYPTMKVFKNGVFWKEYDGGYTMGEMRQYMIEHAIPCPAVIDTEKKLRQVSLDGNVHVAFFASGVNTDLKQAFLESAKELRGHVRMGVCENPEMINKFHPSQGVVFFRDQRLANKFEPDKIIYKGNETKTDLEAWMTKIKHGLVGIRTPRNSKEFRNPIVIAYYDVDMIYNIKQTNYWRNRILKVAKKFKTFTFAVSNKHDFEKDLSAFGYDHFPKGDTPIVVARTESDKFKMAKNFSVKALRKFVRGIKIKKLLPYVKSEKPPKKNKGVVKIVTATTFEDMVLNNRKDAFIMLVTSSCRLCKKVKSLWTDVGKAMVGKGVDILKMNVGKNDRPAKYKLIKLPELYWVPKNDKSNPIRYTGHLEYHDLIEFIGKSATKNDEKLDSKGKNLKDEL